MTEATGFRPFTHVTADKAELYRAVMRAFVAAKVAFVVHLRPEDVHEALATTMAPPPGPRPDLSAVVTALGQLVEWGNLRADPDTGRVTSVEDFLRARYLYQLTRPGEAAETALATYDEALGRRGELQAVALTDIRDRLLALRELAAEAAPGAAPDVTKTHRVLLELESRFRGLADNAQAFMGSLQRTIDLVEADEEAFLAYKERLIGYLERFVHDLVLLSPQIATALREIEGYGEDRLLGAAAEREAADAAPGSSDDTEQAQQVERALTAWRERWRGLRGWFLSEPDRPAQSRLLRERALAAVPTLLAVVAALNERRAGRSNRSADFRTLARWFAEVDSDDDRHRLWRAAFGLAPARHLSVDQGTLAERRSTPVPASTPWHAAPPIIVSPRLRRTGYYERRGKGSPVLDRSEGRRLLAEQAAAEAAQAEAARTRLVTSRPVRLSGLGELDQAAFGLFLALLGDALSRRTPGQHTVHATSADGSLAVTLAPTGDGTIARISTPSGDFCGPDHVVEINRLDVEPLVHTERAEVA